LRPQAVREHQPAPLAASVRPPGQPRRRRRRSRGCATCRRRLGAHARTAAARGGGKGDGATPGPCSSCRCRSRSATPSCPSLPAGQRAPSAAGSSARPHGGARRWSLEQMSRRRRSRSRRWCGLPASVAGGGEIGDGMGPPVPCRRGGACLLRRWGEMHERSHEGNEKREKMSG
jgi:hypothetical protein